MDKKLISYDFLNWDDPLLNISYVIQSVRPPLKGRV